MHTGDGWNIQAMLYSIGRWRGLEYPPTHRAPVKEDTPLLVPVLAALPVFACLGVLGLPNLA